MTFEVQLFAFILSRKVLFIVKCFLFYILIKYNIGAKKICMFCFFKSLPKIASACSLRVCCSEPPRNGLRILDSTESARKMREFPCFAAILCRQAVVYNRVI